MREFLEKVTATKTSKIIFCIIVALPIWALMTFVDFTPKESVTLNATIIEEQVTQQTQVDNETENKTENKVEASGLKINETEDAYFASNEEFAVGLFPVEKKEGFEINYDIIEKTYSSLSSTMQKEYEAFSAESAYADNYSMAHKKTKPVEIEGSQYYIDFGDIDNQFNYVNIYFEKDGNIYISNNILMSNKDGVVDMLIKHTETAFAKLGIENFEKLKDQILEIKK